MTLQSNAGQAARKGMMSLISLSTLYAYMYCMMISNSLVSMPVFGGALFMSGRVAAIYFQVFQGPGKAYLSGAMRRQGPVLLAVMLLISLALIMLYPTTLDNPAVWILFAIVLSIILRGAASRRFIQLLVGKRLPRRAFLWIMAGLHAFLAAVMAAVLFLSLEGELALQIFAGYLLSAALEIYSQWKDREELRGFRPSVDSAPPRELPQELRRVSAFHSYETMYTMILVALQVTLIMMYTYIGITTTEMLSCMLVSLLCTLAAREITDAILKRTRREPDPSYMLLVGLFLWLYGLYLFSKQLQGGLAGLSAYFSLAMCSCGVTVCVTCLAGMETDMLRVARFGAGRPFNDQSLEAYRQMRAAGGEFASLMGQMLALVGLTCLCFLNGSVAPEAYQNLSQSFRPLLVIPAVLMVLGAGVSVLKFPLNKKYLNKLRRFLQIQEAGAQNEPMRRQLENVVVKRHKKRYGVKLILALVRPFYYHKVRGRENVPQGRDGSLIFICNHGELYGPVVTNLYVPFTFRPWVISDIMESPAHVAEFVYKFTIKRQRWLPERIKMPIARMIGRLSNWVMYSIESIPVYRNKPRELMTTFRLSVEAMEAEDNLLIFPENPDAASLDHPGYLRRGIGDFFTGFVMLGPLYYNRTGKKCTFIPLFSDKNRRVLTFGKGVTYDPDRNPTEEKLRIVDALKGEMERIYIEGEAAKAKKKGKKAARGAEG